MSQNFQYSSNPYHGTMQSIIRLYQLCSQIVCRERMTVLLDSPYNSASIDVSFILRQTNSRKLMMVYNGRIVECEVFCIVFVSFLPTDRLRDGIVCLIVKEINYG